MLTPAMMSLITSSKGRERGCTHKASEDNTMARHYTHKASEDNCAPSPHVARGGGGSYADTGYDVMDHFLKGLGKGGARDITPTRPTRTTALPPSTPRGVGQQRRDHDSDH